MGWGGSVYILFKNVFRYRRLHFKDIARHGKDKAGQHSTAQRRTVQDSAGQCRANTNGYDSWEEA
jgi:hypothetical protein